MFPLTPLTQQLVDAREGIDKGLDHCRYIQFNALPVWHPLLPLLSAGYRAGGTSGPPPRGRLCQNRSPPKVTRPPQMYSSVACSCLLLFCQCCPFAEIAFLSPLGQKSQILLLTLLRGHGVPSGLSLCLFPPPVLWLPCLFRFPSPFLELFLTVHLYSSQTVRPGYQLRTYTCYRTLPLVILIPFVLNVMGDLSSISQLNTRRYFLL